jgi:hypothetical protein
VGVCCLNIASKYEEVYNLPQVVDLLELCNNAFSREEFFQMESQVLYALKFNIIFISPLKFIDMIRIQKELTED